MRILFMAICLLLSAPAAAFAEERAGLTFAQAVEFCDGWINGTITEHDVQLQGWTTSRLGRGLQLAPNPGTSGELRELDLFQSEYPTISWRACSVTWRFTDLASRLQQAAEALQAHGFEVQPGLAQSDHATVEASRIGRALVTGQALAIVEPCQDIIIGPRRERCTQATVSELRLNIQAAAPKQ